jgi:hypothetical protein
MRLPTALERQKIIQNIINDHLCLGPNKAISYLPIKTIENVLNMSVKEYIHKAEQHGLLSVTLTPDQCCIASGAVYLYILPFLQDILNKNADTLNSINYPLDPKEFTIAISLEWLPPEHPAIPVIRQAFGDSE